MPSVISPDAIYEQLGLPHSPVIVDVRPEGPYLAQPRLIPGAIRGNSDDVGRWARGLPRTRPVAVYCERGDQVSRAIADELVAKGYPASFLDGGYAAWTQAGHP